MKTMKKNGIAAGVIALALSAGFIANAQTPGNTKAELPAAAQTFIKDNFAGQTIKTITTDKDLTGTEYDVLLSGGTTLEFDGNGNWEEIDGNKIALPTSVLPKTIADYTTQNYAGKAIVQIEKDKKGYDVELADGTDLNFDANGKFLRIDN